MANPKDRKKANKAEYNRKRNAKRKAEGLCRNCSNPAIPGLTLCLSHYYRHRQDGQRYYRAHAIEIIKRVKQRYYANQKAGLCGNCGGELDPEMDEGRKICVRCITGRGRRG